MLKGGRALVALVAAAHIVAAPVLAQTVKAAPPEDEDRGGSSYLKCDGQPNNYTGGEMAAQLLGAVTLLGLFAPAREEADASKRVKGADGVAACTALIEGVKREGNPERRVGLILARAIHQIEDKKYDAALADVTLAEREAAAANLTADPYWTRSRGRSFGLVRAAAQFRLGRVAEARDTALATTRDVNRSALDLLSTPEYGVILPETAPIELTFLSDLARLDGVNLIREKQRLGEVGRFKEAVTVGDAVLDSIRAVNPDKQSSILLATTANDHMIVGDRAGGEKMVAAARANAEKLRADGEPESDQSMIVEALDLNAILVLMADGDLKTARRRFSARSEWASSPFGQVVEIVRRLRPGATPDELVGQLAKTPEELWKDHAETARAALLAKDDDNKTLYRLIRGAVPAKSYEAVSAKVWAPANSKLVLKPSKKPNPGIPFDLLFLPAADLRVLPEAYMLHAALLAQSRGQEGFVIRLIIQEGIIAARISTGKRGDPGLAEPLFNDADAVVADLRAIIPDPATLKVRRGG